MLTIYRWKLSLLYSAMSSLILGSRTKLKNLQNNNSRHYYFHPINTTRRYHNSLWFNGHLYDTYSIQWQSITYLCAILALRFDAKIRVAWYMAAADHESGSVKYKIWNKTWKCDSASWKSMKHTDGLMDSNCSWKGQ